MSNSAICKSDFGSTSAITINQSQMTTVYPGEFKMISCSNVKIRGLEEPLSVYHSVVHFNLVGLTTNKYTFQSVIKSNHKH